MASEKRLIDANALKEKLQAHHDFFVNAWGGFSNLPQNDKARVDEITSCIVDVVNAPTVDAVEVVRCRDCIHRHYVDMGEEIGAIGGCRLFGTPMMTCNDFCSYGERRTDNERKAD